MKDIGSQNLFLVTEPEDIDRVAIELLTKNNFHVVYSADNKNSRNIVGLFIRTYTKADKKFLNEFPSLKYILRAGVGLDNIDINECKERNISVFNAPGSNANAVAEYVVAITLMLLRRIPYQSSRIYQQQWRDKRFIGEELKNKTLGLVGCGAIGKLVSAKLTTFNIKVLGYDPYLDAGALQKHNITKCGLSEILKRSDILSLHLPLTPETRNMFSLNELKKMKSTSMLINTSRGELIKEDDLIIALKEGIIAGCALDVFVNEPHVNKGLLELDNVVLTPHIAGFTKEADMQMAIGAVSNFLKSLEN